jgi:hypothetical protein
VTGNQQAHGVIADRVGATFVMFDQAGNEMGSLTGGVLQGLGHQAGHEVLHDLHGAIFATRDRQGQPAGIVIDDVVSAKATSDRSWTGASIWCPCVGLSAPNIVRMAMSRDNRAIVRSTSNTNAPSLSALCALPSQGRAVSATTSSP